MGQGWISLHRQFYDHWLWNEKRIFSKAEAWIDILMSVNHSQQKVVIKNVVYIVNRGESIMSLDSWAKRWNWNKSKVRRFLEVLHSELMIRTKNETQTTRLTVCNYDSYQTNGNADETQMKRKRNADETQTTPNNNDNNKNNDNNEINIIEIYPTFSDFWDLYDKKVGREISLKKWNKLKQSDKEAIMLHIPGYRNSVSDIQYLKNPTTYLNGKCWNDEIIINKTQLKDERRQQISEFARAARDLQSKSNKTPIYKIGGGNG